MNKKNIFLAAPISAFNNEIQYLEHRKKIIKLLHTLKEFFHVESEVKKINKYSTYDNPKTAAIQDFNLIDNCDIFILYHPQKMQTSSLIELGYAYAKNKKIIIISNRVSIPYLASKLHEITTNVKFVEAIELDEMSISKILSVALLMSQNEKK